MSDPAVLNNLDAMEEWFDQQIDQECQSDRQAETQRFTVDTVDKADWALRKILKYQANIDEAQEFAKKRIAEINEYYQQIETDNSREIAFFESILRPWVEQHLVGRKKSVPLPSGIVALRAKAPEYFIGMDKLSGKNKKLTELVSKHYPEFLKIEEYTDWAGLKETLIITKTGHVVNSDGEIIDWMTGVEYPDEIKVKGLK